MKQRIKKHLAVLAAAAWVLSSAGITALAYTDPETADTGGFPIEEEAADSEAALHTDEKDREESGGTKKQPAEIAQAGTEGTAFSVPGNGQLVDELQDDGTKQFLTIQTKNGNTYFMVLDHSNNTDNVYMLSMIDEDDLAEFTREKETGEEEQQPSVALPETENPPVSVETGLETGEGTVTGEGKEKEEGRTDKSRLVLAGALLAAGIGAGCYFKFVKPQKDAGEEDSEELEFYDGGAYINEDKEGESSGEDE